MYSQTQRHDPNKGKQHTVMEESNSKTWQKKCKKSKIKTKMESIETKTSVPRGYKVKAWTTARKRIKK